MRIRHIKKHRSRTICKTNLRGIKAGSRAMGVQVLHHKARSKLAGCRGSRKRSRGPIQAGSKVWRAPGGGSKEGVQSFWGHSERKMGKRYENIRKIFRSYIARLLRSYIQDFAQEIPIR